MFMITLPKPEVTHNLSVFTSFIIQQDMCKELTPQCSTWEAKQLNLQDNTWEAKQLNSQDNTGEAILNDKEGAVKCRPRSNVTSVRPGDRHLPLSKCQ